MWLYERELNRFTRCMFSGTFFSESVEQSGRRSLNYVDSSSKSGKCAILHIGYSILFAVYYLSDK